VIAIVFCALVFAATMTTAAAQLLGMRRSLRFVAAVSVPLVPPKAPPLEVLIAVFREEERTLMDLVEHFAGIEEPAGGLRVTLVTSARDDASARRVAALLRGEDRRFRHVHAPLDKTSKAAQLNYAIAHCGIAANTFIAVYDADSRPPRETFTHFAAAAARPSLQLAQQYSLYFGNLPRLSPFLRASAVFQSMWTLGYELPLSLSPGSLRPLTYCIGHGLFIRRDLLAAAGGFPETFVTEDLALGYQLSLRGLTATPLPSFDVASVPTTARSLFVQSGRWFAGELEIRRVARAHAPMRMSDRLRYTWRLFQLARWAAGAPLFVAALVASMLRHDLLLAAAGLIAGALMSSVRYAYLLSRLRHWYPFSRRERVAMILFWGPLRCLASCVGPALYVWRRHSGRRGARSFASTASVEAEMAAIGAREHC
jgi:cellulose synthase/poly-beta-1,6-N-acetylglucosamine synthase-like glycosyltransferase